MSFLSANPLVPVVAGVIVVLFMAGLLLVMNYLAGKKQKKNGMDGRAQENYMEDDFVGEASSYTEDPCREKLRRLKEMHEEGLITAEEYEREKEACLRQFRDWDR